jgi:hypothetical protein
MIDLIPFEGWRHQDKRVGLFVHQAAPASTYFGHIKKSC